MIWWCPTFLATGIGFVEVSFSTDQAGVGGEDGLGTIQVHYIYCVLYYYYISSTSDHQVSDSGGRGPVL